jgi:hypothetical protein
MKAIKSIILVILLIILLVILLVIYYGYNSGSCQIQKKYICTNNFCLYKEFNLYLNYALKNQIHKLTENKSIQKRVSINTYPETLFNCALPNKSGVTITTQNINKYCPDLINYYKNKLCNIVSNQIGLKLYPTDLMLPTSCAILIYEEEGDWINWHYDYNYYDGRFFTVLIPITNEITCTEFQFKNNKGEVTSIDLRNNNSICFEGNYLYHRASKLCKNQKRIILSCQFVTNNNMTFINKLRIKLKDFAYTGKL